MMMADRKSLHCGTNSPHGRVSTGAADPWKIEPMPAGLADSPLDFLFADHHRQRQAVQMLLRIAEGDYDKMGVRNLVVFLERDFALHIADEERDFVPLLRKQCQPEDNIDDLIERLSGEHRDDESAVPQVVEILRRRLAGESPSEEDLSCLRAFAEHLRHHLALENGVLLPIARVRMSTASLEELSVRFKERRERFKD